MKKIALIAFLLIVCVAAGRAQESRQDISLSGTGLVEPFIASSTDVQVSANRAFGAMVSYRFMLTPSSAIEANYGITYQNKIHYVISKHQPLRGADPHPGDVSCLRPQLQLRKYNPFVEAGPAASSSCPSATPAPPRLMSAADRHWRHLRSRHRSRDQSQLRHSCRVPRHGHQGAHLRRHIAHHQQVV